MESRIEHLENGHRGAFYIEQQGRRIAELTYGRANDSVIIIDHTEVEPSLRGKGVARNLLDAAVAWARENHLKVDVICPSVLDYIAKHPEYSDLLLH